MTVRLAVTSVLTSLLLCICSCSKSFQSADKASEKIRVVVITGGHGFEAEPFFAMFDALDKIEYVEAAQQDHSEILEDIHRWDYDVMVLYNMTQEISPKRCENFVRLLDRGVGVVALHHSIAAFQGWSEYRRIIGGKYYLKPMEEDGVVHQPGTYKHDIDLAVHVADAIHPITRAMGDFEINDEGYKNCVFEKDNRVLLTTDHPASDTPLCWVRKYGEARVCYIQLGHGSKAYTNEHYQNLLSKAIQWSAGTLN